MVFKRGAFVPLLIYSINDIIIFMDEVINVKEKTKFKDKIKNFYKNIFSNPYKTTLYTGALVFVILLIYYILVITLKDNFYSAYSDDVYQYYPMMIDFIKGVKSGQWSLFSYTNYLGSSVFSDTYYVPVDHFTLIIFLLSYIVPTEIAMSIVELIKLISGMMALCIFMSLKGYKPKWIHLIGLLYFSSSGITCFSCFPSFTSLAFYLPFSLIIAHQFLKKRWYFVPPFAMLCVCYNYYLAYTVFAFMAFTILVMLILEREKWYNVIIKTAIYVGLIIFGLLMGAAIFIPSVLFILKSTSRSVVEGSSLAKMVEIVKTYIEIPLTCISSFFVMIKNVFVNGVGLLKTNNIIIRDSFVQVRHLVHTVSRARYSDGVLYFSSFFDPEVLYRIMGSSFVPSTPSSFYGYLGSYFLEHASLYITGVGILISSYIWFLKDFKSKVYKVILVVLVIVVSLPIFSYIFSANLSVLYTRWVNVLTIPLLLIAAHVLEQTNLEDIKLKHIIVLCVMFMYVALFTATHHFENLTALAVKNEWSEELIHFENTLYYYSILLVFAVIVAFIVFAIIRNKSKKIKAIIAPFAGLLIVGAIALLGSLLLASYSKGGEAMFKTEYLGTKPLFDTDALLANEIFAFVTLILIICAAYFITFKKKKLLIVVIALEFITSACFSFGTPAIMGIEETIYRNTRTVASVVENNTDTSDVHRVYVDASISSLERENIARFFGVGTNQNIFHSFINATTDDVANILFDVADEGQANKDAINVYSYYMNVLLGYKYVVASKGSGFENYDETLFDKIYDDGTYIILEFKDFEYFLTYTDFIYRDTFTSIKSSINKSLRAAYLNKYGIVDSSFKEVMSQYISESEEAKDYSEDTKTYYLSNKFSLAKAKTEAIDSKNYKMYEFLEKHRIDTRSYSLNIYALNDAANHIDEGSIFIEFENGERYFLDSTNVRSMHDSTFHVPVYGTKDGISLIDGTYSKQISPNPDGTQSKPKYIGILDSYSGNTVSLGAEAIFSSSGEFMKYENYTEESVPSVSPYFRYRYSSEVYEGLINISATSRLSLSSIVVQYDDGSMSLEATEFNNNKKIKYIYIDKGSYSQSDSVPSITISLRDSTHKYSDNKTDKMLKKNGSKLIVSYKNESQSDGYEILMVPYSYSEEWALVSGNVKEIISVDGGFIGLVVPRNIDSNEIIIKFKPRGFNASLLISGVCVFIYAASLATYIIIKKKKTEVKHGETHSDSTSV